MKRRFSVCFAFLFFAAVLLVLPVSPRSIAQQASSTSAQAPKQKDSAVLEEGAPSSENAAQAKKSEKQTGEVDPNVFRHASAVQVIARMLHVDVETAAKIFEYINFAIIFLAIVIPLARMLPRAFRKRSETIQKQLQDARSATEEANSRLSSVEQRLAKLDEEIAAIRRQVEQDSAADEVRIKNSIEEERKRIVDSAGQEIEAASLAARRELKKVAAELAVDRALGRLVLTPEADRRLVGEFAREIGKDGKN